MLIVTPQAQARLPIGTVLMYSGLQIANVAARTLPLGQEIGDTISDIPFGLWYVCNGNSGTPNILNKFVRCEDASGNLGGHDYAVVVSHIHGSAGYHNHFYEYAGTSVAGYGLRDAANARSSGPRYTDYQAAHQHPWEGVSGVDQNMPAFYSLIFIIRMA